MLSNIAAYYKTRGYIDAILLNNSFIIDLKSDSYIVPLHVMDLYTYYMIFDFTCLLGHL